MFDAATGFVVNGAVTEHWSRFVGMMFCLSAAAILVVTKVVDYCLNLLADRLNFLRLMMDETTPSHKSETKLKIYRHAA